MKSWKKFRIDEIGKVVGGGTPSSKNSNYWHGDVGWVTPDDLSGYKFRYISKGRRNITNLGLKNLPQSCIQKTQYF